MHKATVTFRDADGTITVAIFFFQLVALLFKDRATKLAYPFMLDILAVLVDKVVPMVNKDNQMPRVMVVEISHVMLKMAEMVVT